MEASCGELEVQAPHQTPSSGLQSWKEKSLSLWVVKNNQGLWLCDKKAAGIKGPLQEFTGFHLFSALGPGDSDLYRKEFDCLAWGQKLRGGFLQDWSVHRGHYFFVGTSPVHRLTGSHV